MRKSIISVLLALVLLLIPLETVGASTTADVTVTAQPTWISISVLPTTWEPLVPGAGGTVQTTTTYFTVTNASSIATHQYIYVTGATWTSAGQAWTHSNTAESGVHTVGLKANKGGTWGSGDVIVRYDSQLDADRIAISQAATTNYDFGLQMIGPTAIVDGDTKENTTRIMATENPGNYGIQSPQQQETSSVSIQGFGIVLA